MLRDSLMRFWRWNFAKHRAEISRDMAGDFVMPTDYLRGLKLNETFFGQPGIEIIGKSICASTMVGGIKPTAKLLYLRRMENPEDWDASFAEVFAYLLASKLAPSLSAASGKAAELKAEAKDAVKAAIAANAIETAPMILGGGIPTFDEYASSNI
jgi:hypothetical protein